MTIAAGFVCQTGVMLCTDTEHTGWAMKVQECKLFNIKHPSGSFLEFAYAGNTAFAFAAMQKCERKLVEVAAEGLLDKLESILESEYRRNVLKNPDHTTNGDLDYQFLIALHRKDLAKSFLFATSQTSIREIDEFECIGSGAYLAQYLLHPWNTGFDERRMLSLAAYALSCVKGFVSGCGGLSQFIMVRHDGGRAFINSLPHLEPLTGIELVEHHAKELDQMARSLLLAFADPAMGTENFNAHLTAFGDRLKELRETWRQKGNHVHESFALLSKAARSMNKGQPIPKDPTRDQQSPPPSPESRGGSDES